MHSRATRHANVVASFSCRGTGGCSKSPAQSVFFFFTLTRKRGPRLMHFLKGVKNSTSDFQYQVYFCLHQTPSSMRSSYASLYIASDSKHLIPVFFFYAILDRLLIAREHNTIKKETRTSFSAVICMIDHIMLT